MGSYLAGKSIVVTGAGRGLGRAVAIACAEQGASVVVADNGVAVSGGQPASSVAESVVGEIIRAGGSAVAATESVATMEGARSSVRAAVEEFGRVDGVVCAAGILRARRLHEMSESDWDDVIATHLRGCFAVFRSAAEYMRPQKSGTMIGFTSAGFTGSVAQANYSAAKGGIVSLVRSAALSFRQDGITVNAIAPVAHTRMMEEAMSWDSGVGVTVPKNASDVGQPEDVAPLVVYLLSERARHVTGQIYTANGNKIAVWNQPAEVRSMFTSGRWTPKDIEERLDSEVGQEKMALIDQVPGCS
jgi:NAD(P)-dependent dehydrogenase (short-subunit alcohol dehydrogenase family)